MSGGVDSAVAAARAVDAGHDVTGVHLALSKNPQSFRSGARGCCSKEDAHDARRAADVLGIPFYVWDLSDRFAADVVDDFVAEYAAGRTPNPCLRCNEKIKFAAVLDRAVALGFDAVCTGHYARLVDGPTGVELHRAVDPAKDQSYVLGVLTQDQLRHALFPLGDSTQARGPGRGRRAGASRWPTSRTATTSASSPTATPPASSSRRLGARPGAIVDETGADRRRATTAAHQFTVGQRRGLRLGVPADDGRPRYVLDISPVTNTVTVGPRDALAVQPDHRHPADLDAGSDDRAWRGQAQVRAHGDAAAGRPRTPTTDASR